MESENDPPLVALLLQHCHTVDDVEELKSNIPYLEILQSGWDL